MITRLRSIVRALVRRIASRILGVPDQAVPIYELTARHLRRLQVLPTRIEMLEYLPKGGIVAEIGVDKGDFSAEILRVAKPSKLHLVDVWSSKRYHEGLQKVVEAKFASEIASGTVEINKGLSTEAVTQFPDDYFDWIYIDTDHMYATTRDELALYAPKVKPGGIIAGHDFIIGNWASLVRYGVQEAVYEFCCRNDWELRYMTMENAGFPSFAIQRIPE
jgi:predicted O-methyltransferase YrrM